MWYDIFLHLTSLLSKKWKYHRSDKAKFSGMLNLKMIIPEFYIYLDLLYVKLCGDASKM